MASREQQEREEAFLIEQDPFRGNAYKLIVKMTQLTSEAGGGTTHLLDEMLHSIFCLGKVNEPTFSPESILLDTPESVVTNKKLLDEKKESSLTVLRELFPRAFELFSSHLPRRSPFSCVLDMIVLLKGREGEILSGLRELIIGLKLGDSRELISSTLCVSHRTDIDDPVKCYGVSMSAPTASSHGRFNPRQCVIAASCLYYWDEYVAGAVLTYYSKKEKKPDNDGTIQLPQWVRCQAFSLSKEEETPPCLSCSNLFGLTTDSKAVSTYGNCAESESLSNLFKTDGQVRQQVQLTSPEYSDQRRDHYKRQTCKDLINCLKHKEFTWREGNFYIPS
uniref:uncharacterized protein LOC120826469 isoform X3 n=1 Tax=Gasterosteus aculeatus aculeatus TaxID=481459 RepID=UPI001A9831BC|nr:uncharacterized protein LOC120826469 isoform X3 [Gasterosteus aculeatus aculeatus]XP_040044711.1 uncharacterized protein LOC120826469 isoform X4 [Gasterosteus aculeatus aculeatus]XP_040044712.1 uncharacterized protein LOC120826469 isoform X3 [Gasterosteus aculeatus aculeatus]